jgi:hypothetical protein
MNLITLSFFILLCIGLFPGLKVQVVDFLTRCPLIYAWIPESFNAVNPNRVDEQ